MWLVQHFLLHSMPYANSTFNIQTNTRTYNYTLSPKPKKKCRKEISSEYESYALCGESSGSVIENHNPQWLEKVLQ